MMWGASRYITLRAGHDEVSTASVKYDFEVLRGRSKGHTAPVRCLMDPLHDAGCLVPEMVALMNCLSGEQQRLMSDSHLHSLLATPEAPFNSIDNS